MKITLPTTSLVNITEGIHRQIITLTQSKDHLLKNFFLARITCMEYFPALFHATSVESEAAIGSITRPVRQLFSGSNETATETKDSQSTLASHMFHVVCYAVASIVLPVLGIFLSPKLALSLHDSLGLKGPDTRKFPPDFQLSYVSKKIADSMTTTREYLIEHKQAFALAAAGIGFSYLIYQYNGIRDNGIRATDLNLKQSDPFDNISKSMHSFSVLADHLYEDYQDSLPDELPDNFLDFLASLNNTNLQYASSFLLSLCVIGHFHTRKNPKISLSHTLLAAVAPIIGEDSLRTAKSPAFAESTQPPLALPASNDPLQSTSAVSSIPLLITIDPSSSDSALLSPPPSIHNSPSPHFGRKRPISESILTPTESIRSIRNPTSPAFRNTKQVRSLTAEGGTLKMGKSPKGLGIPRKSALKPSKYNTSSTPADALVKGETAGLSKIVAVITDRISQEQGSPSNGRVLGLNAAKIRKLRSPTFSENPIDLEREVEQTELLPKKPKLKTSPSSRARVRSPDSPDLAEKLNKELGTTMLHELKDALAAREKRRNSNSTATSSSRPHSPNSGIDSIESNSPKSEKEATPPPSAKLEGFVNLQTTISEVNASIQKAITPTQNDNLNRLKSRVNLTHLRKRRGPGRFNFLNLNLAVIKHDSKPPKAVTAKKPVLVVGSQVESRSEVIVV